MTTDKDMKKEKIKRVSYRITTQNPVHIRFSLWVNGGLICPPGGICLRVEEFEDFIERLKAIPDDKIPL